MKYEWKPVSTDPKNRRVLYNPEKLGCPLSGIDRADEYRATHWMEMPVPEYPYLPIDENTPKDRPIILFNPSDNRGYSGEWRSTTDGSSGYWDYDHDNASCDEPLREHKIKYSES